MTETFQIKYDIGLFEFLNATLYLASGMKMIRRFFILFFTLGLVSFLLGLATTSARNESSFIFIARLISPVLAVPVVFLALPALAAIIFKSIRPNYFKNVTYYFNHWGMQKTGQGIEFSRPWHNFLRAKESKHFIFLYISDFDAFIIQKRQFENNSELESFRQLIHYHLNGK